MTQLIINGIVLPETSHDKYQCYPQLLSVQAEMISGRIVEEVRGHVHIISYQYDYMADGNMLRNLLEALRSGRALEVSYLPDVGTELITNYFICTDRPMPTFAFSKNGVARWHNISFKLREVKPYD